MEVLEAILKRRSIRKFEDRKVENEKIGKLLTACKWAPSAGNRQPWEVIVVKEEETLEELSEIAMGQYWMTGSPVVLVMCINERMAKATYGERGKKLYAIQSTAAAMENMMLRAVDIGLGSCWIGSFDEDSASDLLKCEEHIRPVALIPIGYPAEEPQPPRRDGITSFSYIETFGNKFEDEWRGIKEHAEKAKKKTKELLRSLKKY